MAHTKTAAAKVLSAVDNYIADLQENFQSLDGVSVTAARQCTINDLTDTARLLKRLGVDENIWKRFYHFASALDDLKYGIICPTLRAHDVQNRRPDNSAVWDIRTKIALALDCFLRSGMSRENAAAIVSRRQSLKPLLRTGTKLKTAPLNWLSNLRRGTNKNEAAKSLWDAFQEACAAETKKRTSEEWTAAAERFLRSADEDLKLLASAKTI
jgi:hypothetical protein